MLFLNFHGESVARTSQLRKELKEKEAFYKVAKKTLIKKAVGIFDFKGKIADLEGEAGLVFIRGENFSDIAKFIAQSAKKGKFKILGGIFDKEYRDAAFAIDLSKLPPREIIYAKLLGALNSPLGRLVGVLNGEIVSFIRVLDRASKLKA